MSANEASPTLRRKERERLAHRREILEAAEHVFVRNGYHGATVEEIAHEAEFAIGTIYNFFGSKDDLYAEVVGKLADDFLALFHEQVLAEPDPAAAIGALIELRLRHFEEHRGFVRAFFEAMPGSRLDPARAVPAKYAALYREFTHWVGDIFARGIAAGVFVREDPLYLAICLDGVVNAFVAHWTREEPTEPIGARVRKVQHLLLDCFLTPVGASAAPRVERPSDGV